MKKRILSFAIAISIMASLFTIMPITANAEVADIFTYDIMDGEAIIIDCDEYAGEEIVIPDTLGGCPVTIIGDYAFEDCMYITEITIPASVVDIGYGAFSWCHSLTSINVDENNQNFCSIDGSLFSKDETEIIQYASGKEDETYTIPDSVTTIRAYAFSGCNVLSEVTIPEGVTTIGECAFQNCSNLYQIAIPESVTEMGFGVFYWCDYLESIDVDEDNSNYSSIDGVLFNKDKTELIQYAIGKEDETYNIPESVTTIGEEAFSGCYQLTDIVIPSGVITIGDYAFESCGSVGSINIPASVANIGYCAFAGCTAMESINVDENNRNYTSVDGSLFDIDKTTLIRYATGKSDETYTVPDSVTMIASEAFSECEAITDINVPASVETIEEYAFAWCFSLENINVDEKNPNYCSVDGSLFNKDKTTIIQYAIGKEDNEYIIPDGVSKIAVGAFQFAENLTNVIIPEGVTTIEDTAFQNCYRLTKMTLPASLSSIGTYAIIWCDNLANVYYGGTEEDWNDIEIESNNDSLKNAFLHFAEEPTIEYTLGDVNDDNKVDAKDIILIRRFLAGGYGVTINVEAAKVNGDDKLDVKDIVTLRRFVAGGYGVELQ